MVLPTGNRFLDWKSKFCPASVKPTSAFNQQLFTRKRCQMGFLLSFYITMFSFYTFAAEPAATRVVPLPELGTLVFTSQDGNPPASVKVKLHKCEPDSQ